MEQKFKVIYLGHLSDGTNEAMIAEKFAARFKMPQAKATQVLRAGKEVVLHPGAEHVKAYKLKAALEEMGLKMRLERVQITQAKKPVAPQTKPTTQPQIDQTAPSKPEPELKKTDNPKAETKDKKEAIRTFDTSAMSLEPMQEEEDVSDSETNSKNQNDAAEQGQTENHKEDKKKASEQKVAANASSPNWDLEPMKEETESGNENDPDSKQDEVNATPKKEKTPIVKQEYVDLSKPTAIIKTNAHDEGEENSEETSDNNKNKKTSRKSKKDANEPSKLMELIKKFGAGAGASIVAGLVGILFLLKKFGLLKFLKIGGLLAAAAYAGYNPDEACMGNGQCEDAVSDQIDACWAFSELDQYDWDNMSDDQFYELKPQVEEKFISCFRYEDTGQQVLESPIEVRFYLMEMCDSLSDPVADCYAIAESQIKACYDRAELIIPVKEADYDFFSAMMSAPESFDNFFSCFQDNSANPLFAEYLTEE